MATSSRVLLSAVVFIASFLSYTSATRIPSCARYVEKWSNKKLDVVAMCSKTFAGMTQKIYNIDALLNEPHSF